jgi:hypothetical protein
MRDINRDVRFVTVLHSFLDLRSPCLIKPFSKRCNCQIASRYLTDIFLPPRQTLLRVRQAILILFFLIYSTQVYEFLVSLGGVRGKDLRYG